MAKTKKLRNTCKHCERRKTEVAEDGTPLTPLIRCRNCTKLKRKVEIKKQKQTIKNSKFEDNIRNLVVHLNDIKVKNDVKPKVVDVVEILSSEDDEDSSSDQKHVRFVNNKLSISIINDTIHLDDTGVDEVANRTINIANESTQSAECIVIDDSDSEESPAQNVQLNKETGGTSHPQRKDSVLGFISPTTASKILKVSNKPGKQARLRTKKQKRLEKAKRRRLQKNMETMIAKPPQKPQTPKKQTCGTSKNYCKAEEFWGPAVRLPPVPNINVPISERPLREIIIDGQNVARGHRTNCQSKFSVRGIQLVVEHFQRLGHKVVVFLPNFCKGFEEAGTLKKLEDEGILVYTPSRTVKGQRIQPYDDRYIIDYASRVRGIVVSRDQFRDIMEENPQFAETIVKRLLMYTFVCDHLMFPFDPLGRNGPSLDEFLRFSPEEMQQGNQGTPVGTSSEIPVPQGASSEIQGTSMPPESQGTSKETPMEVSVEQPRPPTIQSAPQTDTVLLC